jgi:retron-type reverse transcriptase
VGNKRPPDFNLHTKLLAQMFIDSLHCLAYAPVRNTLRRTVPKQKKKKKKKKYIQKIGAKKATGIDNMPPKILRMTCDILARPITNIVNHMLRNSTFPDQLKIARISPIYKKDDPLIKSNYRPVSILPVLSKVFERAICEQLETYFDSIFHPMLSAFRRGFSCQTTLIALTEQWRKALDRNHKAGAILMDLSKAFDSVLPELVIEKLKAYNLSGQAIKLVQSYLSERRQCVRVGSSTSSMAKVLKGVPQGSIVGPIIFNIFVNDIFHFTNQAALFNYADDNTLTFCHKDIQTIKEVLENESHEMIKWFRDNRLQANPQKFQGIIVSKCKDEENIVFNIGDADIRCEPNVKLLGITIDSGLNFDTHVKNLCVKVSRQINVLSRIAKFLTLEGRLAIYHSFIMSNFSFCPLVWHFCSKANTCKLEKLHYRALKFAYQDFKSDYATLLRENHHSTLTIQRLRQLALETFKVLNGTSPTYLREFMKETATGYSQRNVRKLHVPRTKTVKYGTQSFSVLAATTWNSLPNHMRQETSFSSFKPLIAKWDGEHCKCAMCR